jgi:beta-phosphoglucomutase-like phosphatase (HAD superfamily)
VSAPGTAGRAPAVLFDVDGTLVDSNYLHVHAWHRAFTE